MAAFAFSPAVAPLQGVSTAFGGRIPEDGSLLRTAGSGGQPEAVDAAPYLGRSVAMGLAAIALGLHAEARSAGSLSAPAAAASLAVGVQRPKRQRGSLRGAKGARQQVLAALTACRAADDGDVEKGGAASEVEAMFRQAYDAEMERSQLLKQRLETVLADKLQAVGGDSGVKITVDSGGLVSPEEVGGRSTWREAHEAIKAKNAGLEEQLKKAQGIGAALSSTPSAATAAAAEPREKIPRNKDAGTSSTDEGGSEWGPFQFVDADKRDLAGFQRLEDLAQNTIAEEAALRLIAVPILGRRPDEETTASLPSMAKVREVFGNEQFVIADTVEFERVYVLKGSVASGVVSGQAIEELRRRVAASIGDEIELFLQRSKEQGRSLIFVMLKEDLPSPEFVWWQWVLCLLLLLGTLASVNVTTFSVTALSQQQMSSMDVNAVMQVAYRTVPTAVGIFATVAVQEFARRVVAAIYGVQLTPPFFIPVWPFPSVGTFGAVTRRLGTVPNEEASVAMSVASGIAGYAVSLAILAYGFALGPDTDKIVNLNFQLLPFLLKVALKPLLGQTSVSDQPDPFADPVSIAFPANPVLIGGVVSLIVTSLNLLPIGRLDGGVIAKSVLGGQIGGTLGSVALGLLLIGSFAPNDAGLLCITFGFFAIFFQNGSEIPPRDAVTELPDVLKILGCLLIFVGTLLSVPGVVGPNV